MVVKLSRLKANKVFIENLRWDVTPKFLFKPRFIRGPEDCHLTEEIQGFMFYIERFDKETPPALMIMKTYHLRSKTVGQIADVPEDLLLNAVGKEGVKDVAGMYPIDEALEAWLKAGLGLGP